MWVSIPNLSLNSNIKFGRFLNLSLYFLTYITRTPKVSVITKKLRNLAMVPPFLRDKAGMKT